MLLFVDLYVSQIVFLVQFNLLQLAIYQNY